MADVNQLRISSTSIARREPGRNLFESHNALLRANRFKVPIMVGINHRTVDSPASAGTPPAEPIRRIEFHNHAVNFFRRGGRNVPQGRDILREVGTNPDELAVFLQHRCPTPNLDPARKRAPVGPRLRLHQVIPYRGARSIYLDLIVRKYFRGSIEHRSGPTHLRRPRGPIPANGITRRRRFDVSSDCYRR